MDNRVLRHEVLTELVRKFPRQNLMGMEMMDQRDVNSNAFTWDEIHQSRDLAKFTHPDSEANTNEERKVIKRSATTAPIKEKKSLDPSTLAWLREPGTEHQQRGRQAVTDEMEDLSGKVDRLVEWMIWEALHGQLIVNQDDVKFSVDYGIPSDHKDSPSTLWDDTANATVIENLKSWKTMIQEDSNQQADRVFMPEEVMTYVIKNESVRDMIGENTLTEQVARTGQIQRLANLDLVVYDSGYVDESGDFQKFVGNKDVIMTTSPETNFGRMYTAPATDPKSNFQPGRFSKSWEEEDPATTQVLIEYHVLPVILKPENIYVTSVIS